MARTVQKVWFATPGKLRRKRVAAYARVSSGKDAMLHSLAAQIDHYSDLIRSHPEWELAGIFADEALTGTKNSREEFQKMLTECREGRIDIIITKSISRFARNTVTLLSTIRELKALGVVVIFEEQNINTMSSDGELLLTLLASFAQAESYSASENMKWRYRKGFENGELLSLRHLFGYSIENGEVYIDEEKAEVIREIFSRFNDGESMGSISRDLKERGITGLLGGEINVARIKDFLSQEKYTGNALLNKSFNNNHLEKKRIRNRGEKPMYYAEGTHEAIISKEDYDRAQERIREINKAYEGRAPERHTIFSGKIRCGKCGANYIKVQNRKLVWQCLKYKQGGPKLCASKQIPDDILRRICCEVLGTDEFDDDLFNSCIDSITADTDEKSNILTFCMADGEVIVKRWENPSRSKSWTPEMREAARESGRKGGMRNDRKKKCNSDTCNC